MVNKLKNFGKAAVITTLGTSVVANTATAGKVDDLISGKKQSSDTASLVAENPHGIKLNLDSEKGLNPDDVSANEGGVNIKFSNSFAAGMEYINKSEVLKLEHRKVNGNFGTLATLRAGGKVKSFLLTGVYNGTDWSSKATIGAGKFGQFNQSFISAELKKAINSKLAISLDGNYTSTKGSKLLNVSEVTREVVGGKEIIKTTRKLEGYNSNAFGGKIEYNLNPYNQIKVGGGKSGQSKNFNAQYSFLTPSQKTKGTISYASTNQKEIISGKISSIITNKGTEVYLDGGYSKSKTKSKRGNDNFVGVGVSIPFGTGPKKYDTFNQMSTSNYLSHLDESKARTLQNVKVNTYTEKQFIPNIVVPDIVAPVFDNKVKNETFELTVGDKVTYRTLTATDNIDGKVTVSRVGNVDTSKPGKYVVRYIAKDKAGNTTTITDTYIVKEKVAPVITTKEVTTTTVLKYETITIETDELKLGETEKIQEGKNGSVVKVVEKTLTDGNETGEKIISETRTEPVNEIIKVGTAETKKGPSETADDKPEAVLTEKEETEILEEIDFKVEEISSPDLAPGTIEVVQEGVKGGKKRIYKVTYSPTGEELGRELISEIITEPVNAIVKIGTGTSEKGSSETADEKPTADLIEKEERGEPISIDIPKEGDYYEKIPSDNLYEGEEQIISEPKEGKLIPVYKVTYAPTGEELGREKISEIIEEPIKGVKYIGTIKKETQKGSSETADEKPEAVLTEGNITEKDIIKYETIIENDDSLYEDEKIIVKEGKNGELVKEIVVTYAPTGEELGRKVISETRIEPVNEIVKVGTKVKENIIVESEIVKDEVIEYETETVYDPNSPKGTRALVRRGENGLKDVTYRVTYIEKDGEKIEQTREIESEKITKPAVNRIISEGTLEDFTSEEGYDTRVVHLSEIRGIEDPNLYVGETRREEGQEGKEKRKYISYYDKERKLIKKVYTGPREEEIEAKPVKNYVGIKEKPERRFTITVDGVDYDFKFSTVSGGVDALYTVDKSLSTQNKGKHNDPEFFNLKYDDDSIYIEQILVRLGSNGPSIDIWYKAKEQTGRYVPGVDQGFASIDFTGGWE